MSRKKRRKMKMSEEYEQDPADLTEFPWDEPEDDIDEDDFLSGVTCNPDAPEECESCQ
jgi:hypothetical protein